MASLTVLAWAEGYTDEEDVDSDDDDDVETVGILRPSVGEDGSDVSGDGGG